MQHDSLLKKLRLCCFSNSAVSLIESYLKSRIQAVFYNNEFSEFMDVFIGIPQGSVLGPFLYILYTNDLCGVIEMGNDLISFADDTTSLASGVSLEIVNLKKVEMNKKIINWFSENKLSVNESKCNTMILGLRDIPVPNPRSVIFLGVKIDPQLKWTEHTQYIEKKINSNIYLLRCLSASVSPNVLRTAYFGCIHSIISYAILAWGHSAAAGDIFKSQRRAIRVLADLDYQANCRSSFIDIKVLTLPCIFILQCLIYAHNNIDSFKLINSIHDYGTRNNTNIYTSYNRLNCCQNSLRFWCIKFYNMISLHLKQKKTPVFKKIIKNYLIKKAFYSVSEFMACDVKNDL